ncbi:AlpA family transcriptional regulator [Ferrimonas balearica]|uniref:helix-turn-helix transcriptional regulator n=1 Tax=Ferrimonas balearica TaxID=44012 RepID=UPI001C961B7D|nr:AlpA family transcriptional regulator [Ferrimonas balearica]MBY6104971.1 AlpA family transcriptional regulator [Ferrimonas balearica]
MKILRMEELEEKVGLKKSAIYRLAKEGKFPKPIKLGPRVNGWVEEEVDEWIAERIAERDADQ